MDDDAVYELDMVDALYRDYLENPYMVIGRRIRKMKFDSFGRTLGYNTWSFIKNEPPSLDLFATTGGGTLFPPVFCGLIDKNTENEI